MREGKQDQDHRNMKRLISVAADLRELVSERIAENLNKIGFDEGIAGGSLSRFESEMRYFPIENPREAILLTQSVLHCTVRLLSCIIEQDTVGHVEKIASLQRRMEEVSMNPELPSILRPFVDARLESLDIMTLTKALDLTGSLSSFEHLLLMSVLFERSHWEILVPNEAGPNSKKEIEVYTNLTFANRSGIFYTPPTVASFIVQETFGRFLEEVSLRDDSSEESRLRAILQLRVCEPACGSSIFSLYYLKALFEVLSQIDEHARKHSFQLESTLEQKKRIVVDTVYGLDIESEAVQLSKIILFLFSGLSLIDLSKIETKLRIGDVLVSNEILGSPEKPRMKLVIRSQEYSIGKPEVEAPFNWSKQYPELNLQNGQGAFDFVFLNPPYGRLKAHKSDFTDKETLSKLSGPDLDFELTKVKDDLETLSSYFRECGDYALASAGELDWHRLMIERSMRLLKDGGRIGFIVPSTILADIRSASLRKYLSLKCTIEAIYCLAETAGLFDTVNQSTCIVIVKKAPSHGSPVAILKARNPDELWNGRPAMISPDVFRTLDPETMPIPIMDEEAYPIIEKLHQYERIEGNTSLENLRGELDLTTHRDYVSESSDGVPLIRGDNIERFICRPVSESRKVNRAKPSFLEDMKSSQRISHVKFQRIVGRQCSYLGKKRRLSFSIVGSNSVVSNSCNYLITHDEAEFPLMYVLGLLNSSLIEWRFRITNSNNHVGNHEIDQFTLPVRSKHPLLSEAVIEVTKNLVGRYSSLEFGSSKEPIDPGEDILDAAVFLIYGISEDEAQYVLEQIEETRRSTSIKAQMRKIQASIVHDHVSAEPSAVEKEMIKHIPPGGNWQNIPINIPSQRLEQIRKMTEERGAVVRTTYYGRLRWDNPSYTISTYFSRIGNGCFIHPQFDRLISLREAARLQSFRDSFKFYGSRTSKFKQIGNAVPPLLAMAIARTLNGGTLVAPFCGAGGLSEGFRMAGYRILVGQDIDANSLLTFKMNGLSQAVVYGDVRKPEVKRKFIQRAKSEAGSDEIDVVAAGPPCTGFSMAGWYRRSDPRNELVYDFLDIVKELNPRFVVMENVQGLVWMKSGAVIKDLMSAIENIGFKAEYQVLKAEQFGVPQLRRRVIIVGSSSGKPKFPQPLFGETGLDLRRPFTVKDAIFDLSHIDSSRNTDEISFCEEFIASDYQRWCRGLMSTDELFKQREFPWVNTEKRVTESILKE